MTLALSSRKFTIALLSVTIAYLLTELAFSSRLLDAAGGVADIADIKGLERWGRTLSGVALGLVAWTLLPHRTVVQAVAGLAVSLALSIPGMFYVQERLVQSLLDDMDGPQRRDAVILATAIREAVSGYLVIDGLVLPEGAWQSPGGKAFAALFPILSSNVAVSEQVGVLRRSIRDAVTNCPPGDNCLGSPALFEQRWLDEMRKLADGYRRYADGSNQYAKSMTDAQARADREWDTYVRELASKARGRSPSEIPSSHWGKVRDSVRERGNDVPANWRPDDRPGFQRQILVKARREAEAKFAEATMKEVGAKLPVGMSYEAFVAHPVIQKRINDALGYDLGGPVPLTEDPTKIRMALYEVLADRITDDRLASMRSSGADFGPGGKLEKQGREAAERLVVPPLALAFSLIGGLTHLAKSLFLAMKLAPVRPWLRFAPLYVLPLGLLIAMRAVNPVTANPVYARMEGHVIEARGPSVAKAFRLVIQAEELVYPVNVAIRKTILMGQSFGLEDQT